jgi:hypothetical protein
MIVDVTNCRARPSRLRRSPLLHFSPNFIMKYWNKISVGTKARCKLEKEVLGDAQGHASERAVANTRSQLPQALAFVTSTSLASHALPHLHLALGCV